MTIFLLVGLLLLFVLFLVLLGFTWYIFNFLQMIRYHSSCGMKPHDNILLLGVCAFVTTHLPWVTFKTLNMFWFLLSTKQLSFLSTHSSILHSVVSILTSIWNHLSCTWKIAITFLPMLMNSFTFSMSVEVFSNLHFEVFPSIWNSKLIIFPFRVLNMLLHCRLVWIIGAGNLPSLITFFLCTCFCSSLVVSKISPSLD